jgi:histone-lysine N-methyltransferase SETMAR
MQAYRIHSSYGCSCRECYPCTCGEAYSAEGKLREIVEGTKDLPIQECGLQCRCPPHCANRVLQHGTTLALEVHPAGAKGLGLFAAEDIQSGSFVIEYSGDLVPKQTEGPYILQIREHTAQGVLVTTLDGSSERNLARYINHSCEPNLSLQAVRVSHAIPHAGFFSLRPIASGEELTFDYSRGWREECRCESRECRGSF